MCNKFTNKIINKLKNTKNFLKREMELEKKYNQIYRHLLNKDVKNITRILLDNDIVMYKNKNEHLKEYKNSDIHEYICPDYKIIVNKDV
jgi:hypothetical protein